MGIFSKNEVKETQEESENAGKYQETCSVCGKAPTDKKWGGQYFHKKCFRKLKKMGKGML